MVCVLTTHPDDWEKFCRDTGHKYDGRIKLWHFINVNQGLISYQFLIE